PDARGARAWPLAAKRGAGADTGLVRAVWDTPTVLWHARRAHTVRRAGLPADRARFRCRIRANRPRAAQRSCRSRAPQPRNGLRYRAAWRARAALRDAADGDAAGAAGLADRDDHARWRHALHGGRRQGRSDPREPSIRAPARDQPNNAAGR